MQSNVRCTCINSLACRIRCAAPGRRRESRRLICGMENKGWKASRGGHERLLVPCAYALQLERWQWLCTTATFPSQLLQYSGWNARDDNAIRVQYPNLFSLVKELGIPNPFTPFTTSGFWSPEGLTCSAPVFSENTRLPALIGQLVYTSPLFRCSSHNAVTVIVSPGPAAECDAASHTSFSPVPTERTLAGRSPSPSASR
jgi:hypothetical protein